MFTNSLREGRKWIILPIIAFFALSGTAHAAGPVNDPQINQWIGVANSYWGQTVDCPGGIAITQEEMNPDPRVWATAYLGGCGMQLDPTFYPRPADMEVAYWDAQMCHIVTHEYGHMLGHDHEATGIMRPAVDPFGINGCLQYGTLDVSFTPTTTTQPQTASKPKVAPVVKVVKAKKKAKKAKRCVKYKYAKSSKHKKGKKHRKRKCKVYRLH